eukprot:71254-Chlamydomonas_euryale.AAC.3
MHAAGLQVAVPKLPVLAGLGVRHWAVQVLHVELLVEAARHTVGTKHPERGQATALAALHQQRQDDQRKAGAAVLVVPPMLANACRWDGTALKLSYLYTEAWLDMLYNTRLGLDVAQKLPTIPTPAFCVDAPLPACTP